ncbi:MAG TPA: hypothetical protein DCG48_12460 [Rhodospirillaceae bacterium]|nr:hypothetical protein [Rhodospirillaceae bacterium]|tara:strand:+ start:2034 stop:2948 length:915 start_codon:yes stop_codon:yes gene_type:complete
MNEAPDHPYIARLRKVIGTRFPYFKGTIDRQIEEFGASWESFFDREMATFFAADPDGFDMAVEGYGRFALEAMKLQIEFDKAREYAAKTYEEAAQEVYQNEQYMMDLYLPGILLSHFLWRHHYKQHIFFQEKFMPLVLGHGGSLFYDVGVGTGFYSKEMLGLKPDMRGHGFDMSPFSMKYTLNSVAAFGYADRYEIVLRDITEPSDLVPAPFIVNIEVLEHLEDPQTFLNALAGMLQTGGYGLISAALTAPNADHIYLYNEPEEVVDQLERAGFKVLEQIEDPAYEPKSAANSVPRNAAFIVTK